LLLELVVDLKNNKLKKSETIEQPGLNKWLSSAGMGDAAVALAGLTWDKLIGDKKV
jgi:hypothetical protein